LTERQFRVFDAPAPRLADADYAAWAQAVRTVLQFLSNGSFREVQFVAAMPLPQDTNPDIQDVIASQMKEVPGLTGSISSAFLQLSYPWLKTSGSHVLLESLEPPDGALAGILARNALTRGTFTSAVKATPSEIFDVWPQLPAEETRIPASSPVWGDNSKKPLIERLSLFGFTSSGLRLLSDVTAYPGEDYRPARVNRLVSVVSRASRRLGEEVIFDNNGPRVWARVRTFLQQLMTRLWSLNALDGATVKEAFSVRCDRSTMSQNDLDNGRLVADVSFTAAATIELIHVTLALSTRGASAQAIAAALTEAA
jgi:phage tail sheath protein FI